MQSHSQEQVSVLKSSFQRCSSLPMRFRLNFLKLYHGRRLYNVLVLGRCTRILSRARQLKIRVCANFYVSKITYYSHTGRYPNLKHQNASIIQFSHNRFKILDTILARRFSLQMPWRQQIKPWVLWLFSNMNILRANASEMIPQAKFYYIPSCD